MVDKARRKFTRVASFEKWVISVLKLEYRCIQPKAKGKNKRASSEEQPSL